MSEINIISKIKASVTMKDIFNKYGYKPNKLGAICCPFHHEKTPSLKAYKNSTKWHCFGCGAGGSVIDFVERLYNEDFKSAVRRIDTDFRLCLFEKPTLGAYRRMQRQENERKSKAERLKREKDKTYKEWMRLCDNRLKYAPKNIDEELHPLYCEALKKMDVIEYKMKLLNKGGENVC